MFLTLIAQTGRLAVPHPEQEPANLEQMLEQDVLAREAVVRLELRRPVPAFDVAAGVWAARLMFRCCQMLVFRDLGLEAVRAALAAPSPGRHDPPTCYSVDIALCVLPDVYRLARGLAPDDPLVTGMRELAKAWPLSSVGMPDVGQVEIEGFVKDACLRDLYVQRIVQRGDTSRVSHPAVRQAMREAVGAQRELAPEIMTFIEQENKA